MADGRHSFPYRNLHPPHCPHHPLCDRTQRVEGQEGNEGYGPHDPVNIPHLYKPVFQLEIRHPD